jgi:hypothetical protein
MGRKTVLLLGAGASVADVATKPLRTRPPLDREFFRISSQAEPNDWRANHVRSYMLDTYGLDIFDRTNDSLEGVMGRLYPDIFNDLVARDAQRALRALLQLFTQRLATTTNNLRPTQKRLLYRMVTRLLSEGCDPCDITIITFNQDIQVEKTLELMAGTARWNSMGARLFSFPHMYAVEPNVWERVSWVGRDDFPRASVPDDCLRVLKLHGSLNWYSTHTSSEPSPSAMFKPTRKLSVTRRRTISPDMTLKGKRKMYTLPVVVPPVSHKSAVLPRVLAPVWALAEERIATADDVVVFGYSCPALDFESANLLTRAHRARAEDATLSIIDPNGAVATRYIDLLSPKRLSYYASAHDFLVKRGPQ